MAENSNGCTNLMIPLVLQKFLIRVKGTRAQIASVLFHANMYLLMSIQAAFGDKTLGAFRTVKSDAFVMLLFVRSQITSHRKVYIAQFTAVFLHIQVNFFMAV